MQRIIWHWTAGTHKANAVDKAAYHYIIEGDGTVVRGKHKVSDNQDTSDGHYARHTANCNTGSIGVALAAMHDAQESPFSWGKYPITHEQMDALADLTAKLCREYKIPVTRHTVLSHAEVEPTLGIKQRNKWDIAIIPNMDRPGDPVLIGDAIRSKVERRLSNRHKPKVSPQAVPKWGILALLLALVAWLIGRK